MKNFSRLLYVTALALLVSGCGSIGNIYHYRGVGLLYTHKVRPLTLNHHLTPAARDGKASGDRKTIQYQYIIVTWDYNAIGEIAKKAGIKTIHYADLETLSVLGIWSRHTVHIYGTAEEPQGSSGLR